MALTKPHSFWHVDKARERIASVNSASCTHQDFSFLASLFIHPLHLIQLTTEGILDLREHLLSLQWRIEGTVTSAEKHCSGLPSSHVPAIQIQYSSSLDERGDSSFCIYLDVGFLGIQWFLTGLTILSHSPFPPAYHCK